MTLSGLAKYTYSKMQNAGFLHSSGLGTMLTVLKPSFVTSSISPGCTSRISLAATEGNAQDSDEMT